MREATKLVEALEHLRAGRWDAAHAIAQDDGSTLGSWLHGIVHLMEGDHANARYWYRRAGRPFPDPPSIDSELAALGDALDDAEPT